MNVDTNYIDIPPNNLHLDQETFSKWAPINNVQIGSEKTIDSVHDELSIENPDSTKPAKWEDMLFPKTIINGSKETVLNKLHSSECVVIDNDINAPNNKYIDDYTIESKSRPNGYTPYLMPDNNNYCYVRDCFKGTCVPGLNNLLDQSSASMMTFLETMSDTYNSKQLNSNPLLYGGLGHMLYDINKTYNRLPYTAYYNFDVLIFRYIYNQLNNNETLQNVYAKCNGYPSYPLTLNDIILINTINLNYLWCRLINYCYERVTVDEYLIQNNEPHIRNYTIALKRLGLIRFNGFYIPTKGKNNGYIENPTFVSYGNTIKLNNIDYTSIINSIYANNNTYGLFNMDEEYSSSGGIYATTPSRIYATTQSMSATCITSVLGKLKSVVCRKGELNSDKKQCMLELNNILKGNVGPKQAKGNVGYGWNIIKFSGDSSHICYGDIIEDACKSIITARQPTVVYLVSERPLMCRLIAARKSVLAYNNVAFVKEFNGVGSAHKNNNHAAYFCDADLKNTFFTLLYSIQTKDNSFIINPKYEDKDNPVEIKQEDINVLVEHIKESPVILLYDTETMLSNISINNNYDNIYEFAKDFIGRKFFGYRIGTKINWNSLLENITNKTESISKGFFELKNILSSLITILNSILKLKDKKLTDTNLEKLEKLTTQSNEFIRIFFDTQTTPHSAIFNRIMTSKVTTDDARNTRLEATIRADFLGAAKGKKADDGIVSNDVEVAISQIRGLVDACIELNDINKKQSGGNPNSVNKSKNNIYLFDDKSKNVFFNETLLKLNERKQPFLHLKYPNSGGVAHKHFYDIANIQFYMKRENKEFNKLYNALKKDYEYVNNVINFVNEHDIGIEDIVNDKNLKTNKFEEEDHDEDVVVIEHICNNVLSLNNKFNRSLKKTSLQPIPSIQRGGPPINSLKRPIHDNQQLLSSNGILDGQHKVSRKEPHKVPHNKLLNRSMSLPSIPIPDMGGAKRTTRKRNKKRVTRRKHRARSLARRKKNSKRKPRKSRKKTNT